MEGNVGGLTMIRVPDEWGHGLVYAIPKDNNAFASMDFLGRWESSMVGVDRF